MFPTSYCDSCSEEVTVIEDESRGTIFCANCGTVIDESGLVDDQVSFNSQNQMQGQLVRKGSAGGGLTESREVTIRRAKDRLRNIALKLRLSHPERMIDLALNMYKYCLEHGHTRGRPGDLVAAACLYIICRRQKTPHMLLDFSEALKEDIFRIGRTFFQLITRLDIKDIPLVEPWLYIERFASELGFEDEQLQHVSHTAMRLISGMKKDWIQTGRRPTSICAAALLLSSKIHNCPRTKEEITKVMRICEGTLLKRLDELEKSNVGKMTLGEIRELPLKLRDDTEETRSQDLEPPCVQNSIDSKKRFRKKKKRITIMDDEEDEDDEEEENEENDNNNNNNKAIYQMKDLDQLIGKDPNLLNEYQEKMESLVNCPTFVQMSNDYMIGKEHEKEIEERIRNEGNKQKQRIEREYNDEEIDEEELDKYIIKDDKVVEEKTKAWRMIYGNYMKEFERKKKERLNKQKERERRKNEKKERTKKRKRVNIVGSTAAESASRMLRRKMSEKNLKKIGIGSLFSWDKLDSQRKNIFSNDDDDDDEEEAVEDEIFGMFGNDDDDDEEEELDENEPARKKRKVE